MLLLFWQCENMNSEIVLLFSVFMVMGLLVLMSYMYCVFQITKAKPETLDIDSLWAGFYEDNDKSRPRILVWFFFVVGEITSWIGVMAHLTFFIVYEQDSSAFTIWFVLVYIVFFVSLLFWPLCAVHGLKYYMLTIVGLVLTCLASFGLFALSIHTWGWDQYQSYLLLPLFLHTTIMDLGVWGSHWNPRALQAFSSLPPVCFTVEEE